MSLPLLLSLALLLGGGLFGFGAAFFFYRTRAAAQGAWQAAELRHAKARLREQEEELQSLQIRIDKLSLSLSEESRRTVALQTRLAGEREQAADKLRFQERERANLKTEFEALAQRIFDDKSDRFSRQNLENIGMVLKPLREQIGDFKKRVEDVYDKESRDRTRLSSEILQLKGLNERISQDAINLTNALKGESKTRGNWGEVILERILEDAGLCEGREFERERVLQHENGQRQRPDVVIHLPDHHDLIVDSKVSLAAFEEAMSLEPGSAREAAVKRHISALREHITSLGKKSYQSLLGVNTLDFVLMFVPIEPALHTAFADAPEIFQEAYEKNIFIVSPTTLLMACRTVQNIWRTDRQNENALEISRQAGNMIDKFVGFVDDLDKVGNQINKAADAYQDARKKLDSGKGNLLKRAQDLEQLGAKGQKQLPQSR